MVRSDGGEQVDDRECAAGPAWGSLGSVTIHNINIAKGTTDPRVEFIPAVQTQILIKFHLQNLDQAST